MKMQQNQNMRIFAHFWRLWYLYHPGPSKFTRAEAQAIAKEHGYNPDETLQECDIYPYDNQAKGK